MRNRVVQLLRLEQQRDVPQFFMDGIALKLDALLLLLHHVRRDVIVRAWRRREWGRWRGETGTAEADVRKVLLQAVHPWRLQRCRKRRLAKRGGEVDGRSLI